MGANRFTDCTAFVFAYMVLASCSPKEASSTPQEKPQTVAAKSAKDTPQTTPDKLLWPNNLLWGDTHLHTSNSADAFSFGARLTPADAYRFAKGETVISTTGQKARLLRPLDFLVIADHAEGMGISQQLYDGNPTLMTDAKARRWHKMLNESQAQSLAVAGEMVSSLSNNTLPKPMTDKSMVVPLLRSTWQHNTQAAEDFNDPGTFTALIGYEYTSVPSGNNLHRVVIFKDGKDKADQTLPFSSITSRDPEDLWAALQGYENKTGGSVLAIPHNSNLSNGRMFAMVDFDGKPIDADYTQKRARWEPVVEITQIKGDSESHPFLSPNDEFAGYGDAGWDLGNLSLQELKTPDMFAGEYVREALKNGLILEETTGTNPFKLGIIGSTDAHTGLSTGREENYFGKHTSVEPQAGRMAKPIMTQQTKDVKRFGWQYLAGGYAGVWAHSNTRADIWDALKRKEVYGTTGPRMRVRFFGGGNFKSQDIDAPDFAKTGYAKGVPMGGDLQLKNGETPNFLITAMKDPDGANLDRLQVIKGWRDTNGEAHEKVYDVKWSGNRTMDAQGKLPAIGTTVTAASASFTNTIGAAEFSTVWRDPDFKPEQAAFYYVRVLQIPTPRWPLYDAKRYEVTPPKDAQLTSQERAYTSPIWYTPK